MSAPPAIGLGGSSRSGERCGPGFGAENPPHLFEPFYTTKPAAWAWGYRSADPSSKIMVGDYGQANANQGAQAFSSRFLSSEVRVITVANLERLIRRKLHQHIV